MAAMRFMHLGYTVFIVGETNTPILEDLLLVASGSGTTSSVVSSAEKAKSQKLQLSLSPPMRKQNSWSGNILLNKCCNKTDFGVSVSRQYAGSLFEQFTLFILEGVFMTLWQESE
jgi:6-phospho-3-hexuloisomerase